MSSTHTQPIFISSTFLDMHIERDFLRDVVFRELEEIVAQYKINLEAIDLRWGIDTSAETIQDEKELQILKVCLDEIDRCRPFILVFLGNRYGSVPPEVYLRSAATEKGVVLDNYAQSVTALEIEYGAFQVPTEELSCFFYFREIPDLAELPPEQRSRFDDRHHAEHQARFHDLEALKSRIKNRFPERCRTYTLHVNDHAAQRQDLQDLQTTILTDLSLEFAAFAKSKNLAQAVDERPESQAFEHFVQQKTRDFVERDELLDKLKNWALSDGEKDPRIIALTGEPGSGKSAVMAMLAKNLQAEDCLLLPFAAGVDASSKSLNTLIEYWIHLLRRELNIENLTLEKPEESIHEKLKVWEQLLDRAAEKQRVVLLIDALNELERLAINQQMSWLPKAWNKNVVLIASTVPGSESQAIASLAGASVLAIPPLQSKEAASILLNHCRRYHKSLSPKVSRAILEKTLPDGRPAYQNPLWLSIVIEQLILLDIDDFAEAAHLDGDGAEQLVQLMLERIQTFSPNVAELYQQVFSNADRDLKFRYGIDWVFPMLEYLALSRGGLREADLLAVLKAPDKGEFTRQFSLVRRFLRVHLRQSGVLGQWQFTHLQPVLILRSRVNKQHLYSQKHKDLSDHLNTLPLDDALQKQELLFHLTEAKQANATIELLASDQQDNVVASGVMFDFLVKNSNKKLNQELEWLFEAILSTGIRLSVDRLARLLMRIHDELFWVFMQKHVYSMALAIVERARKIFNTLPKAYLTETAIVMGQVKLARRHAKVLSYLGKEPEAIKQLKADINPIFSRFNSDNIPLVILLEAAEIMEELGGLHRSQGQLEEALEDYLIGQRILELMSSHYAANGYVKQKLALIYRRIGTLELSKGNFELGLSSIRKGLDLLDFLLSNTPNSIDYQLEKAHALKNIATAFTLLNPFSVETERAYLEAFTILETLHRRIPDYTPLIEELGNVASSMGSYYRFLERNERSIFFSSYALTVLTPLHKSNPNSKDIARSLNRNYNDLAFSIMQENPQEALKHLAVAEELGFALQQKYPNDLDCIKTYAETKLGIGILSYTSNFKDIMKKYLEDALSLLKGYRAINKIDYDANRSFSMTCFFLGQYHSDNNNLEEALNFYYEGQQIIEESSVNHSNNVFFQYYLMMIFSGIGWVFIRQNKFEEAILIFQKSMDSISQYSNNDAEIDTLADLHRSIGIAYEKQGNLQRANHHFNTSLELFQTAQQKGILGSSFAKNHQWIVDKLKDSSIEGILQQFEALIPDNTDQALLIELLKLLNPHSCVIQIVKKQLENDVANHVKLLRQNFVQLTLHNKAAEDEIIANHTGDEQQIFLQIARLFELCNWQDEELYLWKLLLALPRQGYTAATLAELLKLEEPSVLELLESFYEKAWILQEAPGEYLLHFNIWKALRYLLNPQYADLVVLVNAIVEKINNRPEQNPYTDNYPWLHVACSLGEHLEGQVSEEIIELYSQIGRLYTFLGSNVEAKKWFEKAVDTQEKMIGLGIGPEIKIVPLVGLSTVYRSFDQWEKALQQDRKALKLFESAPKISLADQALVYNSLGLTHLGLLQWEEADQYLNQALSIRLSSFPEGNKDIASSYQSLAFFYMQKGQYQQSLTFDFKALAIKETIFHPLHPSLATTYNNLGNAYLMAQQYEPAQQYLQQSIAILEKVPWPQHLGLARAYYNLARTYQLTLKLDEAEMYHLKAISIREAKLAKSHTDLGYSYFEMACVYREMRNYALAGDYFKKSLMSRESSEQPEWAEVIDTYMQLGWVYYLLKKYQGATDYFKNALSLRKKHLSHYSEGLAENLFYLGLTHLGLNHSHQALVFFIRAAQIQEAEKSPQLSRTYYKLAETYESLLQYHLALIYYEKIRAEKAKTLPPADHSYGEIYHRLGLCYKKSEQNEQGLAYLLQSIELTKSIFGPEHPKVAQYLHDLGLACTTLKDYPQAIAFYDQSIAIREKILDAEHIDLCHSYNNKGYVYSLMKEYDPALFFLHKSLEIKERILMAPHAELNRTYHNLVNVYLALNDEKMAAYYRGKVGELKKK
ncbi:tetratricopeptide repeat protein [Haliscomenobacter sp.]|uniref:tetratricopeptide repeat protein n=1 Tax=Haliscomenobacter sp. TaxID=2717303 RepID=UPI003BAC5F7A